MHFDDYLSNDMLGAAAERQFEIIGEAFVGLRRADPALASRIVDLPALREAIAKLRGAEPEA